MFDRIRNICGSDDDYTIADDSVAGPRNDNAADFLENGLRKKFLNEYLRPTATSDDFLE